MVYHDFRYKGVLASDMGVIVTKQVRYKRPAKRVTSYTVPGRSGTLTALEEDAWDEVVYAPVCALRPHANAEAVWAWLMGSGDVTFGSMQDYVFTARIGDAFDSSALIEGAPHGYVSFTPIFVCDPMRRAYLPEHPVAITSAPVQRINPGNVASRPLITISCGSAVEIALTLGGTTCNIALGGAAQNMVIDTDTMRAINAPERSWDMDGSESGVRIPPGRWSGMMTSVGDSVPEVNILPRYRWI